LALSNIFIMLEPLRSIANGFAFKPRERDNFVGSTFIPRFNAADSASEAPADGRGAVDGMVIGDKLARVVDGISSGGRIDRAAGSIVSSAGGATR
jgi:hypothetical protein